MGMIAQWISTSSLFLPVRVSVTVGDGYGAGYRPADDPGKVENSADQSQSGEDDSHILSPGNQKNQA